MAARSGHMGHPGPPIRAVLFDVDGTLLDTREFILRAFEHALGEHRIVAPPRKVLSRLVGRELPAIYQDLGGDHLRDRLVEAHRAFQAANLGLVQPFAGAAGVLEQLRAEGYRLAAVTSRSRRTSERSLEVAGLARHLEVVISAEDAEQLKPHPAPLLLALERLSHNGGGTVMVGDTAADIEAGQAIGAITVAAVYGFHGQELLAAGPDHVIEEIGEVPALLQAARRT